MAYTPNRVAIEAEQRTSETVDVLIEVLLDEAELIWHWGDGRGGALLERIREAAAARGYPA